MGLVIALPLSPRPRSAPRSGDAQILLFTGVWRERYETAPPIWSSPKRRAPPKRRLDAPKGPSAPRRGKQRA